MNIIFNLKEHLVHPLMDRVLQDVLPRDEMKRDVFRRIIDEKVNRLLVYAIQHVPYYRSWWAREGRSGRLPQLTDFPILTKGDIRGHEREFVSDEYKIEKLNVSRTSGSTGEPFMFYRGTHEWDYSYAVLWRGLMRYGIRPGDKRVLVKGVDEVVCVSWKTKLCRAVYGWINRCIVIDAHFLAKSEDNVLAELKRIVDYRPLYFHGYVSSIYLLARTAEEHGIDLSVLNIKAIVTESEKCHPFQRELMERVFRAPVVENYGCVEFGMIAQPARDGVLCVNEDHVFLEMGKDEAAIITNLDAYAFPLIRFKNGDKLILGPNHSVLPYRTVAEIEGRIAETIHLPQGGALQGYVVMYPISKHMNVLRAYQVYQPDFDHLIIRLLPIGSGVPNEILHQIFSEMRKITGPQIDLKLEIVETIPLTKRGKRAFVVSDVSR